MIFFVEWFKFLLPLWIYTIGIGIISFPISYFFFKKSSDRGFVYGILLGTFGLSFIYFTLGQLGLLNLSYFSLYFCLFLWVCVNLYFEIKYKVLRENFDIRKIWKSQLLFILTMTFWYWVRGHNNDIHEIERFMDYGILNTLFTSKSLPIEDFWMTGLTVNYYYLSHFVIYTILKLTFIPKATGFIAIICWSFGMLSLGSFRFGKDLFTQIADKNWTNLRGNLAGLLSVFFVVFAGNFHVVIWLKKLILDFYNIPNSISYWYADSTRYITDTITEMPVYGFSISDNHPHVWGSFVGLLVLALLTFIWFSNKKKIENKIFDIILLGVFLGWAYMTNSWDILTLGMLSIFVLVFKYGKENKVFTVASILGIFVLALALSWPWSRLIKPPINGIGIVHKISNLREWLTFWGPFLFFLILSFKNFKYPQINNDTNFFKYLSEILSDKKFTYYLILTLVIVGFWVGIEIFYVKDLLSDGQWYRANTFFKVCYQQWLWLGLILGPSITLLIINLKVNIIDQILYFLISLVIILQAIAGGKLIHQANLDGRKFEGITNTFTWLQESYPDDYSAIVFLATQSKGVIVEYPGESFKDNNYASVYLGWPTIIGWSNHEWTWRGSYDLVSEKQQEVREIYEGVDINQTKEIIDRYKVKYIIIGQQERINYPNINYQKLSNLASPIYANEGTTIMMVQ